LVSINIEGSKHLERVKDFLRNAKPDVVCMQEVFRHDLPFFQEILGKHVVFAPMFLRKTATGVIDEMGIVIFTASPTTDVRQEYYYGNANMETLFTLGDMETCSRVLLSIEVDHGGTKYRIGTTHFTWSPDGKASDEQHRDVLQLLHTLSTLKDGIVFCGDFNAPRGGEIFARIAALYKDNLPPEIKSTLDPVYHRAPPTQRDRLAVDTIFSTPEYVVDHVEVIEGISDHKLLRAFLTRAG